MSTYYPIEFLPENPNLGKPTNRNYFRNNLPYQESSDNTNSTETEVIANLGRETTFLESSLNNNKVTNKHENSVSKEETKNISGTNKIKNRITRVNIDSRLRNIQPKHILDSKLNNLQNCLFFTYNSNIIYVYHPNHGYAVEDKIIMEYATSTNIKIKNGIFFEKGSIYAKIYHPNHNMIDGYSYTIQISNVIGNIQSGTYLLNYPVNLINKTHPVYFRRTSTDPFDSNNYYIKLDIKAEIEFTYKYSFNLQFLHIKSIPLNQINANYPISPDRMNGFHIIDNVINNNFYTIQVTQLADSSTLSTYDTVFFNSSLTTGLGGNIMVIKILDTISGYPDNNKYQINLQRNFYHVKQINLLNAIFPITQKLINTSNNMLYWQNLSDGDTIYSITIPHGNYNLSDLETQITTLINNVIRPNIDSTQLINNTYTYNYNKVVVTLNSIKNTASFQFYQNVILTDAIFISKLVYQDGFTRVIVNYTNHNLISGNTITFSNVLGTDGIPEKYLNGNFNIENIIDQNTFTIKLDRFNSDNSTNTNGGKAINILVPIKSRLLFNVSNTLGNILGFNNVGDSNSVTSYNYVINNYDNYEIDIDENSVGIITASRQNTRILNLNPNNYILMLADVPFNDQLNLFDTGTFAFAKIYLAGELNNFVYDQFVQMGCTFQEPLSTLSTITFTFNGPDGNLYDFNNVEHSFTIEIVEQLDELNIVGMETG